MPFRVTSLEVQRFLKDDRTVHEFTNLLVKRAPRIQSGLRPW